MALRDVIVAVEKVEPILTSTPAVSWLSPSPKLRKARDKAISHPDLAADRLVQCQREGKRLGVILCFNDFGAFDPARAIRAIEPVFGHSFPSLILPGRRPISAGRVVTKCMGKTKKLAL